MPTKISHDVFQKKNCNKYTDNRQAELQDQIRAFVKKNGQIFQTEGKRHSSQAAGNTDDKSDNAQFEA